MSISSPGNFSSAPVSRLCANGRERRSTDSYSVNNATPMNGKNVPHARRDDLVGRASAAKRADKYISVDDNHAAHLKMIAYLQSCCKEPQNVTEGESG